MGQYIQEGKPIVFETVIQSDEDYSLLIGKYNQSLKDINIKAISSVASAHYNGHSPSIIINIARIDEFYLGQIMQFFILASIMGALMDNNNPFDQPGVEAYKTLLTFKIEE